MCSNIARQAIYNSQQQIIAYELLFREGCCDSFPDIESEVATVSILDGLFHEGTVGIQYISDGLPCFVNFCHQSLIQGIAFNYPPEDLVIEVLENCEANAVLYKALEDLKSHGYQIAFDDFVPSPDWLPFLRLADIVKIDFRAQSLQEISQFVNKYRKRFDFKLLAEKIETEEEYRVAIALGFDYFQGFQLSKPERIFFSHVA
ncbi:signal transduction protein [Grimontia hollisae]|uniref:Predicted signal transduction protein containing sensor and EAL domains n=1 Tax=Grimontia hollisae TaxID=673 RepID=A0A377HLQ1_GRIHO|nr:EAL domain-containing protein [Grimontia hollisae]AMG29661.1 signal transduction protein [Grimontia hollisae]MDF2184271.1 EAL domain-containing protein [Grimontia hollisae]STO43688.1 Predicted signal transduction protein containing sensor and EAL domains [Grimontia hollisae]STO57046.1 Predicted signal transduction protein containing sensor and EAL domains [Grimontia hollisae]STQ74908.1 Predicted signal transduction protein containing sensor and EAL domains [Grimontia hollisae]